MESAGRCVFWEEFPPFGQLDGFGAGEVFGTEGLWEPVGGEGVAALFEEALHHCEDVVLDFVGET